jgi:peptidoglycan/LPS O-acetylase OafA/YrhL
MIENRRLFELDAMRGLAASSVLLFHFGVFKYGCTGVDLFFIISGFVIFMSLEKSASLKRFWLSRLIRLFPSYWLSVIITIASVSLIGHEVSKGLGFVIGNALMLQPLFKTTYINSVYWTLYVELLFYSVMSCLWYINQLKNIEWIILLGLIAISLFNGIHLLIGNSSAWYTRTFIIGRSLFPLVSHFQTFAAGIIFYKRYTQGVTKSRIFLLLFTIIAAGLSHNDSVMINSYLNTFEHIVCLVFFYIAFVLVIKNKMKFLRFKLLIFLGAISYPLYLIHEPVAVGLMHYLATTISIPIAIIISSLVGLMLSYLMTYGFDIPMRRWLKREIL